MSLVNFRNYESLELDLEPGIVLIQGANGQGKSNLLEAIYILAVAKSPRTSSDRELIRWQSAHEETYSRVSAVVRLNAEALRAQIDFRSVPAPPEQIDGHEGDAPRRTGPQFATVQKYIRVNGVPRRASELVGQVNAVMFSADDMELVYGPPPVRRRYLDVLLSQLDRRYLRALQRYQRVVYQRNHLLRMVKEGTSRIDELDYWNGELVDEGKRIMAQRLRTVERLSELAGPIHGKLTDSGESLELLYHPSVPVGADGSEEALAADLRQAMERRRERELAQCVTVSGPHRDDLQLRINGMDAGVYASRGQSRTAVLAIRLAEAHYLLEQRRREPVLLLDDVLSELDPARQARLMERVGRYQQCFITTAAAESIDERFLSRMSRFVVREGQIGEGRPSNGSGKAGG